MVTIVVVCQVFTECAAIQYIYIYVWFATCVLVVYENVYNNIKKYMI